MDHIAIYIQPFVLKQVVGVHSNGECIKFVECKMSDVAPTCLALCKEFDIHQVDLGGSTPFAEKIKDKIIETNFDNFHVNVDIH